MCWRLQPGPAGEARGGQLDLAFSTDRRILAYAFKDASSKLWNVAVDRPLPMPSRHRAGVWTVAFRHYGRLLASGPRPDDPARRPRHGARPLKLEGHQQTVHELAFCRDVSRLFTASEDESVPRMW